jgi:hypothetical protein
VGVVQRRVLRGLWRRLVGVGIFGPGLLGAPAFIMFVLLAAPHFLGLLSLACFPWLAFLGAAFALRP